MEEGTRYSAARFLPNVSRKKIWSTILTFWAFISTGLPNQMLLDQGSQFGPLFVQLDALSNVYMQHTGVEAHSGLCLGVRCHQTLRNTYRKIIHLLPKCNRDHFLAASITAMNDTLGSEGLVPSALVVGEFPKVISISEEPEQLLTLNERE